MIKNVEDLRKYMKQLAAKVGDDTPVNDDRLLWFVCYHNARIMMDGYSTKDIASMLLEGVKPTTFDDIQPFIDTFYEDLDEDGMIASGLRLQSSIHDFYGDYKGSEDLADQADKIEDGED